MGKSKKRKNSSNNNDQQYASDDLAGPWHAPVGMGAQQPPPVGGGYPNPAGPAPYYDGYSPQAPPAGGTGPDGHYPYDGIEIADDEEAAEAQWEEERLCCGRRRVLPSWLIILAAVVSLAVATFDIVTDAFFLKVFVDVDRGPVTVVLTILMFVSGVLYLCEWAYFFMQTSYFCCTNKKLKERNYEKYRKKRKRETNSITATHEVVTYLLLLVEDVPGAVVIFMLSHPDIHLPVTCQVYEYVLTKETFIDDIKLLAAFVSALWKGVQSLRYLCVCEWYSCPRSDWARLPCGCLRALRPVLAAVMCFCAAYVYFVFGKQFTLAAVRPECLGNGTAAGGWNGTDSGSAAAQGSWLFDI